MKKITALLLAALLAAGCTSTPEARTEDVRETQTETVPANEDFSAWLESYVIKICQADYTTMHHYFEHPEQFGMDPETADYSLGSYLPTKEDEEMLAFLKEGLEGFDPATLDQEQYNIWMQLKWNLDITTESYKEENLYQGCIWSTIDNPVDDLVSYFSEYVIRDEADIEPLFKLIEDIPVYLEDAVAFSQEQADRKLLMMDYTYMTETISSVLDARDDSAVTTNLMEEVEALELDEEKEAAYKEELRKSLDENFFTAIENLEPELASLNWQAQPIQPVAAFEGGKDYYKLILKAYTGTSKSPEEIRKSLEAEILTLTKKLNDALDKNRRTALSAFGYTTDFESPEEIMQFLEENYDSAFPKTAPFSYELEPLADDQSTPNVVAYFINPPVDNTQPYQIRYNKKDYGDDTTSLSFYQTMAHEGIPGHMYQTQYDHEHFEYVIQYLQSCLGFQEGYATYVEMESLGFLDMSDDMQDIIVWNTLLGNYYTALMDIQINYEGMTSEEFAKTYEDLFGDDAIGFYQTLATNPGVYMSYYYGFLEIDQIKQNARQQLKDEFDEVEFNNALLESGNVNFSLVQENVDRWIESKKQQI